jgi:rare lipoprotein A
MPPGVVSRECKFEHSNCTERSVMKRNLVLPWCRSALIGVLAFSAAATCQAETGLASYYGGRGHHGEMTCAHRTRPFGSVVTVTHAGYSIRCRVNDRGPFVKGRVIDVSLRAARALGMMHAGVVRVSVE